MTRLTGISLAVIAVFATAPAMAQNASNSNEMSICKTKLETQQVDVTGAKDNMKQASASKELDMARAAMAKGNSAECLIHIEKSRSALR